MTSESRTRLPSGVASLKSGAFSPTAGGVAAARGSTAAKATRDINAWFKDTYSPLKENVGRVLASRSTFRLRGAQSYAVGIFLAKGAGN
jgi:hypothetical protein